jgi:ankyrin repeat protein
MSISKNSIASKTRSRRTGMTKNQFDSAQALTDVLQSTSDVLFPDDLGERAVTIDSRGYDGDTPLHVMAWRNDLEGAEILVNAGADVNAPGEMSETPLHVALRQENAQMVEMLLRAGARDDIRGEFGHTPRDLARGIPHLEKLFAQHDG